MDLANVFIGLTCENEEVLLYKNADCYIDLRTKKLFPLDRVRKESLFSYADIIPESSIFKFKIISNYEKDRKKELKLKNCFIGDVCQVKDVKHQYINTELPFFLWEHYIKYRIEPLKPRSLLYKIEDDYQDLETGILYPTEKIYEIGDYIIDDRDNLLLCFQSVFEDTKDKVVMEKGKVLEKYRSVKFNK